MDDLADEIRCLMDELIKASRERPVPQDVRLELKRFRDQMRFGIFKMYNPMSVISQGRPVLQMFDEQLTVDVSEADGASGGSSSGMSSQDDEAEEMSAPLDLRLKGQPDKDRIPCNICGQRFTQRGSLLRHLKAHSGDRPFPCSVCAKRFADKERLKVHFRIHTGEKPFSCSVCGMSFSQKSTVTRHMSVHTKEKTHLCLVCNKYLASADSLRVHMNTQHHYDRVQRQQPQLSPAIGDQPPPLMPFPFPPMQPYQFGLSSFSDYLPAMASFYQSLTEELGNYPVQR